MSDDRLERLATAIADGAPVDWALEESAAPAAERRLLRELRVVAGIAAAARAPGPGPGPGDAWGPLRIRAPLGSGAFGDVYRAHDPRLGRDVALKLLREGEPPLDVVAEGGLLARVRHPGVVTVYGADHVAGRTGVWMELVDGRTLEDLLRESGPWDARAAALAGAELCGALVAVHDASLVHRDVKAGNVMRESGGRIVLTDFGVARLAERAAGRPAGTPLYMAPEVLAGAPATPQSDLYSVGVLLYHLVTGGYPVAADDVAGLERAHASGRRRPLREARPALPEAFVSVVERALEPGPERRFRTAVEMELALRGLLAPPPAGAPAASSRHAARWIAVAAVALAVFVLSGRDAKRGELPSAVAPPSTTPPPATAAVTTPSPPPTTRGARVDPFVAPLGAPPGPDATPAPDVPYSVEARHDAAREELRLRSSHALSLYVFAIDADDRPLLRFPIPGRRPENPLVPDQEHRLWIGGVPSGSRLVAVGSLQRLAGLEHELARTRVPLGSWYGALPLTPEAVSQLGAAIGFAARDVGRFLAGARPLPGHVEIARGLWVRRLERAPEHR